MHINVKTNVNDISFCRNFLFRSINGEYCMSYKLFIIYIDRKVLNSYDCNGIEHFVENVMFVSCQRSLPLHSRRPRVALLLSIGALCVEALYESCDPQLRESVYPKSTGFCIRAFPLFFARNTCQLKILRSIYGYEKFILEERIYRRTHTISLQLATIYLLVFTRQFVHFIISTYSIHSIFLRK